MSIVCKTLVLVGKPETMRIVTAAFPQPKYELEFIGSLSEAMPLANHVDLFVVDSKFLEDKRIVAIRNHLPTVIIEPEFVNVPRTVSLACGVESDTIKESEKIRIAAEKLLRKSYFNWIVDALEYTS
jgi:hypothetical protein